MKQDVQRALVRVSDQCVVPDEARPGEWKCRLCGGGTKPGGPVIHTLTCSLTLLYEALEDRS